MITIGRSFVALLLALFFAYLGQVLFSDRLFYDLALICYMVAIAAMFAYAWLERRRPNKPLMLPYRETALIALSLFALGGCLFLAQMGRLYAIQVALWLASMALFAVSFWPRLDRRGLAAWLRASTLDIALVLLITLLALALRAIDLEHIPGGFHGDEGEWSAYALSILNGTAIAPFGLGWDLHPTLYSYLQAGSMAVFGRTVGGVRMLSALVGALTIPLVYCLMRNMFGFWSAVLSAALLALSRWHIHFSRLAMNDVQIPFMSALALLFLYRGIKGRGALNYCLSGLAVGLCFYFGNKAVFLPPIMLALLLYVIVTQRGYLRDHLGKLVVFGMAAAIAFAPLGLYYLQHDWRELLFARTRDRSIFQNWDRTLAAYQTQSGAEALIHQTERAFLVFNYFGDNAFLGFTREPVLDPVTAPLYVLGLAYSLYRLKETEFALLCFWFLVPVIGNIISIDPPQVHRMIALAPVPAMLATLPLREVYEELEYSLSSWVAGGRRALYVLVVFAFLTLTAYENLNAYFVRYAARWPWVNITEVAREIKRLGNDYSIYLVSDFPSKHGTIRFIAAGIQINEAHSWQDVQAIGQQSQLDKDIALVVTPSHAELLSQILQEYKDGEMRQFQDYTTYILKRDALTNPGGI